MKLAEMGIQPRPPQTARRARIRRDHRHRDGRVRVLVGLGDQPDAVARIDRLVDGDVPPLVLEAVRRLAAPELQHDLDGREHHPLALGRVVVPVHFGVADKAARPDAEQEPAPRRVGRTARHGWRP